jgi:hypothetical protein
MMATNDRGKNTSELTEASREVVDVAIWQIANMKLTTSSLRRRLVFALARHGSVE